MAHRIAVGCRECNGDIAIAEEWMAAVDGYCNSDMFLRIPLPRPVVTLDGNDMTGKEVVAINATLGLLTRNHLRRMPDGEWRSHLCECESDLVAVELWEGKIGFAQRDLDETLRLLRERAAGRLV